MTDKTDSPNPEKDFLENLRKMMAQAQTQVPPQTDKIHEEKEQKKKTLKERLDFSFKPKDIKRHLDKYVIKQEEAKRVLATAICDHYNHIRQCEDKSKCRHYSKQNVLMFGPTGVGKTYLIRSISELIGVPFVKADATKFSETGYVGGDVEDLIRDLSHSADGDNDLAECGIVYLDEVDKIASALNGQNRDVSGSGVQRGLLKIMEETDVSLKNPQDLQSQMQSMMEFQQKGKASRPVINTRHILFILSGSFTGLSDAIQRRLNSSSIGFSEIKKEEVRNEDLLRQTRTEDLIQYGFEPEFVGRVPVRVVCDPLNAEDLYTVLTASEGSILRQYKDAFKAYDIDLTFEDEALWEIAKRAAEENTGARGLVTVCEAVFRTLKYELPSSQLRSFVLTKKIVHDAESALEELLREEREIQRKKISEEIQAFEIDFKEKVGVSVQFSTSAYTSIQDKVLSEALEVKPFLEKHLSNYGYGLTLIHKKNPKDIYTLDSDAIENPNAVLEKWIKSCYEH